MEICCNPLCGIFFHINWIWYVVAIAVAYGIGAVWYSSLFSKTWMRIFKIEMPEKINKTNMIFTMLFQLLATALYGLVYFALVHISIWLAILALVGFCGWRKAGLKFQFAKWKDFLTASLVDVGYMFVTGVVFILFGLI